MGQQTRVGTVGTRIDRSEGCVSVYYHGTPVVTIAPQGTIHLRANGWYTVTTKLRMNQASTQFGLGFHVFQQNHLWYVKRPDGSVVAFEDGMTFPAKVGR